MTAKPYPPEGYSHEDVMWNEMNEMWMINSDDPELALYYADDGWGSFFGGLSKGASSLGGSIAKGAGSLAKGASELGGSISKGAGSLAKGAGDLW